MPSPSRRIAELARFHRARRHLCKTDLLENLFEIVGAEQHLFAAAARGNHAHAHFHQPHVQFRRRLNPPAVQRDLAAAAERQSEGRGNHRFGRVLQRHVHLLEGVDRGAQFVPLLFLRGEQDHHQIRADGKILALVADDHGIEIRLEFREARAQHVHDVVADRVRFAVKFAAEHAVAEVD